MIRSVVSPEGERRYGLSVEPRADGRIAVRTDGRVVRLRLDEIERIEADRDTSCFHLRAGATLKAY